MPFKKGQSGNPKGRPRKNQCIPDILRKICAEEIDTKNGRISKMEGLMRMVYRRAVEGDQWAVNFIADRTEGKPLQKVESVGDNELIITRKVVKANKKEK